MFDVKAALVRRIALAVVATAGAGFCQHAVGAIWVNEFHYDNVSTDSNEFFELVVGPGMSINDAALHLYNGDDGANAIVYDVIAGSAFTAGDTVNGFTFWSITLSTNGIQNGLRDGFALVVSGVVEQLLSYEGVFTAGEGPATGMTSVDIGVAEFGTTPVGAALQLSGSGSQYSDFTWTSYGINTKGSLNTDQTLVASGVIPEASTLLVWGLLGGCALAFRRRLLTHAAS